MPWSLQSCPSTAAHWPEWAWPGWVSPGWIKFLQFLQAESECPGREPAQGSVEGLGREWTPGKAFEVSRWWTYIQGQEKGPHQFCPGWAQGSRPPISCPGTSHEKIPAFKEFFIQCWLKTIEGVTASEYDKRPHCPVVAILFFSRRIIKFRKVDEGYCVFCLLVRVALSNGICPAISA